MFRTIFSCFLFVALGYAQQTAPAPVPSAADLVKEGQKLNSEGKQDEALSLYRKALDLSPNSYEAHLAAGIALDLKSEYAAARDDFTKALELAPHDARTQVLQASAISYAFEGRADQASQYEVQIFSTRSGNSDLSGAAGTANELGRIYLQSGDMANALKWYKVGYDTALKISNLTDADQNLWLFRWEHAQARIAASSSQPDEARKHVAAAKAALDKANNPDQLRFFPYLTGYVALYARDYKTAIIELQKADQRDPMILALLGEAYEKSGDLKQARDYYGKVLAINSHNLANASARPLAMTKLGRR